MKPTDRTIITNAVIQAIPWKTLSTAITSWQSGGSPVFVSGVPSSEWGGGYGAIPEWTLCQSSDYTILYRAGAIRQKCVITSFVVNVYGVAAGVPWDFKLFRWSVPDSAYLCVASVPFQPAGSGTVNNIQSFTLATPVAAAEGDIPGIHIPILSRMVNGNNFTRPAIGKNGPKSGAVAGDVAVGATNPFTQSITTLFGGPVSDYSYPNMLCVGRRPYAVYLGDSLVSSGNSETPDIVANHWYTDQENQDVYHTPGGSPGNINFSVPHRLALRMPAKFTCQMFSQSGSQFSDMIGLQAARAVAVDPKVVFIHCGYNDLFVGSRAWPAISADLDTLRGMLAGRKVFLDEVLPLPGGSTDPQAASIRALNANYAAYCTTNNWKLVFCHEVMGDYRPSTGFNDTLKPGLSNGDAVHINLAGADLLASLQYQAFMANLAWVGL